MRQKDYLVILKTGIFLSFIFFFFVFSDLLFPYITSKQISFNILMEVLLVVWVAFIVKYPEWRPKKSWISIGLVSFMAVLVISCFTGVDFNLSFWGDVERMLGVFHLLHFLIFYFIIITVMRTWRDWRGLLIVSVSAATLLSLYGIVEGKADSRIGNKAYVAGLMIFNIYFCLLLFFREYKLHNTFKHKLLSFISKDPLQNVKWLYLLPIPVLFWQFYIANITGAIVGLGFSILLFFFLFGITSKGKKIKIITLALTLLLVVAGSLVLLNKDSKYLKDIEQIQDISLEGNTFKTRLIAWEAVFKDFKNHPVLGTGHGNFAVTFDKYFTADFYDYVRDETYFDRAHNNILDILSTSGILGLLAYLSIFIAVAYYLIRAFIKKDISNFHFSLLTALFAAYFVQNLAVFDSFVTYVSLMVLLGYVYWLSTPEAQKEPSSKNKGFEDKEIYALVALGLIMLFVIYQFNLKPYQMLNYTIRGQVAFNQGNVEKAYDLYKEGLEIGTVLDRDSRGSFVRSIAQHGYSLNRLNPDKRKEILDYAIELAEKNIAYNPADSMMQMRLAQVADLAASLHRSNEKPFNEYWGKALEAINKATESAPERIPLLHTKAQILMTNNKTQEAVKALEKAKELNKDFERTYCLLGRVYLSSGEQSKGYDEIDTCLQKGGESALYSSSLVKNVINHYLEDDNWEKVTILYERLSELDPRDSKVWINLAKLYAETGKFEKAKNAAYEAARLDNDLSQSQAETFVKQLEEQQNRQEKQEQK